MDKLDALAKSVRDMLRDHPHIERITVYSNSDENGLTIECAVHNNDGTVQRIIRTGEAPF